MKNPPATTPESTKGAYHFITHWQLPHATTEEVYRTLEDVNALPIWWPSVYLDIAVREPGQPGGVGKLVELYTKGWLPYTLRWHFRVTQADFPHGFSLEALGDFIGRGIWTFQQEGSDCTAIYDWKITAEKPLLRRLTWLLRPAFAANHEWAMRKGLESLLLELRRRRGEENVQPPPPANWPHRRGNHRIL